MKKYFILIILIAIIPSVVYAHESCNETNTTLEKEILPEGYCNVSLNLRTDKTNYDNGEKIIIYNDISEKKWDFLIDYWIENEEGENLRNSSTNNANSKQYTPKLTENSTLTIKNNISEIGCININNNTYNQLSVFIKVKKSIYPNISIEKLYLNKSKKINIGENITSLISVYTGENENYTINVKIENLTNSSYYIIKNKFNSSYMNISIEIPNQCNITSGEYIFSARGINAEAAEKFTIINNCKTQNNETETNYSKLSENKTEIDYNHINSSESIINLGGGEITGKLVYESTSIKAKKIASYMFMVILAAILIIIMNKNKSLDKILKKTTKKWSSELEQ